MKEFGEFINTMFERQMAYLVYDDGLGNMLGRDVIFMLTGFTIAMLLILSIGLAKEVEKMVIRKIKRWWRKRQKEKESQ